MIDNSILGKRLDMVLLRAARSEVAARLKELEPALAEADVLAEDNRRLDVAMARFRAENGGFTPDDIFMLTMLSKDSEVFNSLCLWVERVTTSNQVSLEYGPTCEMGPLDKKEFYPYLFVLNMIRGITPELIADIAVLTSASVLANNQYEILFRMPDSPASDASFMKYDLVVHSNADGILAGDVGGMDVSSGGDLWDGGSNLNIEEALNKVQAKTVIQEEEFRNPRIPPKKLFGIFTLRGRP